MKYHIFLFAAFVGLACNREKEFVFYDGTVEVYVSDGEIVDTVRQCYCWRTKDSVIVEIHPGPFAGIAVHIGGKAGEHRIESYYYTDDYQYDGKLEMKVPSKNDSLSITYQTIKDSLRISGYVNLLSKEVKFFKDRRKVKAYGNFSCTMKR